MKPRFELDLSQNVKQNVLRMIHEQYDQIIFFCNARNMDPDKSVHEIRKSFKRLRALLRLIRDAIGYSTYYRENSFCRDESKLLSDLRDLKVFHEDLTILAEKHASPANNHLIEQLQETIIGQKNKKYEEVMHDALFKKIAVDVEAAKERASMFLFRFEGFSIIAPGIKRIYRKGRKELDLVRKNPNTENYHNLRKRVKYLMYFMQILNPLYPQYFKTIEKDLDKASDKLGLDHNFAELVLFVENIDKRAATSKVKNEFIELIEGLRLELQQEALQLVENIYVEPAAAFTKRVKEYFDINYTVN
ncbi:CHAD domain-containing protein [Salinivirga cyanobacteriivorans]